MRFILLLRILLMIGAGLISPEQHGLPTKKERIIDKYRLI